MAQRPERLHQSCEIPTFRYLYLPKQVHTYLGTYM